MIRKLFPALLFLASIGAKAQPPDQVEAKRVRLPNGWSLTPAGSSLPLGDLPLNMAVSASGKYIAVTNNGQSVQSIQLIDPFSSRILDIAIVSKAWYGLKFTRDEKYLYAAGGNDNWILKYELKKNKLILADSISLGKKWPEKIWPAGIEIDEERNLLYAVTKENNSLYLLDIRSKKVLWQYILDADAYACVLSPDKKTLYISCWGCDKVLLFDTKKQILEGYITVGDNPNELLLTKNGNYLFVANANDNSVSVIDTKKKRVLETLNTALYPSAPPGSTANGLALSRDEKTLYAANADNNCLAVFDFSRPGYSKSKGFIPTGWYPTNVKVIGNRIFVANGKGFNSLANPYGPNPTRRREDVIYQGGDKSKPIEVQYIGGLFKGTMSIINVPSEKQLAIYSRQVYINTPYTRNAELNAKGEPGNPIPMKVGAPSPIKYVFYIIKENRTYDQVLSDMPGGNGDTSLLLFGEKITPNQHKLAGEFVLLDNFYCDGEVSADGHNWSMGAYATDYLEKTWPTSYGGRGGSYVAEGNRPAANNKGGFIWDHCNRNKVSYRTYGEFADNYKPNLPVLKDHYCPFFTGWDMGTRDTTRFYQWKKDFDSLLSVGAVPAFNSIRFGNDHTEGLRKGKPTPFAHVADNDLAVGLFVEYLSHSPIWKESVVFILEDDAQNGPDHVDAHRSTAYLAGGFVKRSFVDHSMYSTSSMLRTIELILGMPPMTQYDAAAEPMWRCFNANADVRPFTSLPSNINLADKNIAVNEWQRRSEEFNFAKEDAIPDLEFNIVLWYGIKGNHIPYPAPNRAAFLKLPLKEEDDDD
jgi:YVTN family beta-propeller protein